MKRLNTKMIKMLWKALTDKRYTVVTLGEWDENTIAYYNKGIKKGTKMSMKEQTTKKINIETIKMLWKALTDENYAVVSLDEWVNLDEWFDDDEWCDDEWHNEDQTTKC